MAVGSGPNRGASVSSGGSNYTFRNVPGSNSVGNWNTGGSIAGYGNQNGMTRTVGGYPPGFERGRPLPTEKIPMKKLPPLMPQLPPQLPKKPVAPGLTPIQRLFGMQPPVATPQPVAYQMPRPGWYQTPRYGASRMMGSGYMPTGYAGSPIGHPQFGLPGFGGGLGNYASGTNYGSKDNFGGR